jgi:hypothetical protein
MLITVKCEGWVRSQSWLLSWYWSSIFLKRTEEEHKKLRIPGVAVEH